MRYGVVTQLSILMYEKHMILFNLHVIVILEKDYEIEIKRDVGQKAYVL